MSLLYRLRRSVALFVCPEMGAEARLKASLADARTMRAPAVVPAPDAATLAQAERPSYSSFMAALADFHFRAERPPFIQSYRYAFRRASECGWAAPSAAVARRWIAPRRALRPIIPTWDRDPALEAAVARFAEEPANREQLEGEDFIYWDGQSLRFAIVRLPARFRFNTPLHPLAEPMQSAVRQRQAARPSGVYQDLELAIAHISGTADRFTAVIDVLADRRAANLAVGGDDSVFLGIVAAQTVMITLPVAGGRK